jgi:hypothetical protein
MSNEINEVKSEIDAIKLVLISHGPVFSGGDRQTAQRIANEWHDYGFDAAETDEWCGAGCWDASVAAEFHEAHMTPRIASRACERYDERHGQSRCEDAMYEACNGNLPVGDIIADWLTPDEA